MAVKLINPRGRVISVEPEEVTNLLKRGFIYLPPEQKDVQYNQVYDKGPDWKEPFVGKNPQVKVKTPTLGDTLIVDYV